MSFDAGRGRYRYVITRPCIENGSITVLKYLEPVLPLDGQMTFVGDAGEEITVTADRASRRITGLSDYYAKQKLGVNDLLFITRLGERRYQLECTVKPKDEARNSQRTPMPAPPRRVVVEESPYVREVRQVRGPVSAPNLAALQTPKEPEATPVAPSPSEVREAVPVARAPREDARASEAERVNPVARASGLNPSDGARLGPPPRVSERNDSQTAPRGEAPAPVRPIGITPTRQPSRPAAPPGPLEAARRAFGELGYRVTDAAEALLLEADLGRRHYAALLVDGNDLNSERLASLETARNERGARYLGVLLADGAALPEEAAGKPGVVPVRASVLERLLGVTRLAPVGPLELEGYWNASGLTEDAADSLEATAAHEVASRGAFSFTVLSLARFRPHSVVSAQEVISSLEGSGIRDSAILETLEGLARAPFMLLSRLGGNEYYIRQPVASAMEGLADYASTLKARVRNTPERN
jgi:hypothetical protein